MAVAAQPQPPARRGVVRRDSADPHELRLVIPVTAVGTRQHHGVMDPRAADLSEPGGRLRWPAVLAWCLGGLSIGFVAGSVVLNVLNSGHVPAAATGSWYAQAITAVVVTLPGTLIAARQPRNPIGWLFLEAGLSMSSSAFGGQYGLYAYITNPGSVPGGIWGLWAASRLGAAVDISLPFIMLLFPTGRLLSPRWRPAAWFVGISTGFVTLASTFWAGQLTDDVHPAIDHLRNPVGLFGDVNTDI